MNIMRYNVVSARMIAVSDMNTKGGFSDGVCSDPDAAKMTLKPEGMPFESF